MNSSSTVEVAFCCDKHMLPGLHVALESMLNAYKTSRPLVIVWLYEGVTKTDIRDIEDTISKHNLNVTLQTIPHNIEHCKKHASLHGSYFPYARLDLARIVQSTKIVYLDSDLIINTDVAALFDYDLQGEVLAAPWQDGTVERALDAPFLVDKLQIQKNTPYFNSGVLLIDLSLWREMHIDDKVNKLLSRHGASCISHDQSILNALFGSNFKKLPGFYNVQASPIDKPKKECQDCIIHLTGLPKPWDPFGYLNTYSSEWCQVFSKTAANKKKCFLHRDAWIRLGIVWPSIVKLLYKRFTYGMTSRIKAAN